MRVGVWRVANELRLLPVNVDVFQSSPTPSSAVSNTKWSAAVLQVCVFPPENCYLIPVLLLLLLGPHGSDTSQTYTAGSLHVRWKT